MWVDETQSPQQVETVAVCLLPRSGSTRYIRAAIHYIQCEREPVAHSTQTGRCRGTRQRTLENAAACGRSSPLFPTVSSGKLTAACTAARHPLSRPRTTGSRRRPDRLPRSHLRSAPFCPCTYLLQEPARRSGGVRGGGAAPPTARARAQSARLFWGQSLGPAPRPLSLRWERNVSGFGCRFRTVLAAAPEPVLR